MSLTLALILLAAIASALALACIALVCACAKLVRDRRFRDMAARLQRTHTHARFHPGE